MQLAGRAKKVTIFVGHPAGEAGGAPYLRILERLKAEGAAGATAFRAIAAFGARAHVQTVRLADVAPDLPVMIVWIDTAERVERILPHLTAMVAEGLIAVEDVEVQLYTTTAVPDLPPRVTVGEVMTREVVAVHPETPMRELVEDLVARRFRAVPVIDAERRVVGIVTNGDLVRRGGLPVRLELLATFDTPALHEQLARLAVPHREVREVMSSPVVTVRPDLDVRHAAEVMLRRKLKRLPVVDAAGRLVGIVSRVDLLHTVARGAEGERAEEYHPPHVTGAAPVRSIMTTTVPAIPADATLPQVVNAVASTRLNQAVVVDERRHVLGIVTDAELIERLTPQARPGVLSVLMHRIPFVHGSAAAEEALRHATGKYARDLMQTDIVVAHEDEPVRDVLAAMLAGGRKVVPIVDEHDELTGLVDRADLLRVLVEV
jgi:CBS-domain-containing membrane protein